MPDTDSVNLNDPKTVEDIYQARLTAMRTGMTFYADGVVGDSDGYVNSSPEPLISKGRVLAVRASDLSEKELPPVEWLVPDILPLGLTVLCAPSKYFKSYMALDLCLSVCSGSSFMGIKCNKYDCLYLDLESTARRPKARIEQILGDAEVPNNLYIITADNEVPRINNGFKEFIYDQLEQHPGIKFIVVDVFQLVKAIGSRAQNAYEQDYESMRELKSIVGTRNIGMMLIHHTNKLKGKKVDVFEKISGSTGIMGAADSVWMIDKKDRFSSDAMLYITGRDVEQRKLQVFFNKDIYRWENLGDDDDIVREQEYAEYANSPIIKTIKMLLQDGNTWEGSITDLIGHNQKIKDSPEKVVRFINRHQTRLLADGIQHRTRRINSKRLHIFSLNDGDTHDTSDGSDTIFT